jgi:hypothetical protein
VLPGLLALAGPPVELAEPEMALGDGGAHTKLSCHSEGLAILAFGLLGRGRRALGRHVAEEPERVSDLTPRTTLPGDLEGFNAEARSLIEPVECETRRAVSATSVRRRGMPSAVRSSSRSRSRIATACTACPVSIQAVPRMERTIAPGVIPIASARAWNHEVCRIHPRSWNAVRRGVGLGSDAMRAKSGAVGQYVRHAPH